MAMAQEEYPNTTPYLVVIAALPGVNGSSNCNHKEALVRVAYVISSLQGILFDSYATYEENPGIRILQVFWNTPAQLSGLRPGTFSRVSAFLRVTLLDVLLVHVAGDLLTEINSRALDGRTIRRSLRVYRPGDQVLRHSRQTAANSPTQDRIDKTYGQQWNYITVIQFL